MPLFAILIVVVLFVFIVLGISYSFKKIDKERKESKLSVFEHPSTFEKQPVEWFQKPKEEKSDPKSKKL